MDDLSTNVYTTQDINNYTFPQSFDNEASIESDDTMFTSMIETPAPFFETPPPFVEETQQPEGDEGDEGDETTPALFIDTPPPFVAETQQPTDEETTPVPFIDTPPPFVAETTPVPLIDTPPPFVAETTTTFSPTTFSPTTFSPTFSPPTFSPPTFSPPTFSPQTTPASFISNLTQPVPILQQQKSVITTNPFIPDSIKVAELTSIQNNANEIMKSEYKKNTGVNQFSLTDLHKNITKSFMGVLNDSLNKDDESSWFEYIFIILGKDQRYVYIGILLIITALIILLINSAE